MNFKPFSASILALAGIILVAIGLYFIFLRPALLPEDMKYMNIKLQNIEENLPGLLNWLQKVFLVLGGYILTTGMLLFYISQTLFRNRDPYSFIIVLIAGICSIGLMTIINFIINSDFKWILLIFTLPWALALGLYRQYK